jgi:hypothetical protein
MDEDLRTALSRDEYFRNSLRIDENVSAWMKRGRLDGFSFETAMSGNQRLAAGYLVACAQIHTD